MRKVFLAFVIAGLMAVLAAPASAVVLYDNGGPDTYEGLFSDPVNGNGIEGSALYEAYNQFTLSSAATITGIEWWGFYYPGNTPPATDAFKYDVQSNPGSAGEPSGDITSGALGSLTVTDTHTLDAGFFEIYQYTASASISLPAGLYYLSIYDTAPNSGNTFAWQTSTETALGTAEWSYDTTGTYGWVPADEFGLAFNLTGESSGATVPEPATMTLLGLGLAGLATRVARRKNR